MIQVFMLIVIIGLGTDRKEIEEKMYFRSVEQCNEVARHVAKHKRFLYSLSSKKSSATATFTAISTNIIKYIIGFIDSLIY